MSEIEPRSIPRPWVAPESFSWRLLSSLNHMARLDLALKVLVPLLLVILVGLAIKCGSFRVYLELFKSQTYTSFIPAVGRLDFLSFVGVDRSWGGGLRICSDSGRIFSYQRYGVTGRMASLIWLDRRAD